MNGKPVALVTGGSRGIGRGICLALAHEGFTVLVNYLKDMAAAEKTCDLIEKAGGSAELCQADVSLKEHRDLLLDFCMENLGRLDVLVNNAGIPTAKRVDLLQATEASYDQILDTNLKSVFFLSQAAARLMIGQIEGKSIPTATIVNISSISAYAVNPNRGDYCISKAGVSMVTRLFAMRLATHGINVYEVRPGMIATDMTAPVKDRYDKLIADGLTPIRRWGQPEDVGRAVAMLARGDLAFTTGSAIDVDGGFHMRSM